MKKTILILSLLVGGAAYAEHHEEMKEGKFADRKAEMLQHIDKRIEGLNGHKACVSAAADKPGLKACRSKMKEAKMENKKMRKGKRMERKAKRKERKKGK